MPWALPRDTLTTVGSPPRVGNRSLFADKFAEFADDPDDKKARSGTIQQLTEAGFDAGPAAGVRCQAFAGLRSAVVVRMKLEARLIVNHAGGVIENAGLALDRNSGLPYIPGSTVKGIARVGASLAGAQPAEIALVFGWAPNRKQEPDLPGNLPVPAFAGAVAFLSAWPVGNPALEREVVTVHHRAYYERRQKTALDNEQPVPNEFPAVKAGTEFQFVLVPLSAGRAGAMRDKLGVSAGFDIGAAAREWLTRALREHGVGAKTAAGYGWFEEPQPAAAPERTSDYNEASFKNAIERRLARRGEWNLLREELQKLRKPENAVWKERFLALTRGKKAYKELRAIVEGS